MKKRQTHKKAAQETIAQATKQIASANDLLMHLPADESASPLDAVDPSVGIRER